MFKGKSKSKVEVKSTGFFPWQKNKDAQRVESAAIFIAEVMKHLPAIKEILRPSQNERPHTLTYVDGEIRALAGTPPVNGLTETGLTPQAERAARLYDFYLNYTGSISSNNHFAISTPAAFGSDGSTITGQVRDHEEQPQNGVVNEYVDQIDQRKTVTPKSVLKELEQFPAPDMAKDLDEKIATLKDKSLMVNQIFANEQIKALIKRLENRKKYHEYEDFYKAFPNTNDEKIDLLLSKYKLVIKTTDIFVPTFPKEAIDVMKEYTRITLEMCGEQPVYYVIAEEGDFKKKFEKLDPILLVQSPFGFWWQVLGAWDKEMLLLCEL